jgi:hypothetical protein
MKIRPFYLFALERYDRAAQSVRVTGGVIVAVDGQIYVGRLMVGSDTVEDKTPLIVPGRMEQRLFAELQKIAERPGTEVTREFEELFALFSDANMTERSTTAAFIRQDTYSSFLDQPARHERTLRDFVAEQAGREPRTA